VDVRLLSATHKNLADMVKAGSFRQDLYYRINVIDLHLPALRQRTGDIAELVEHILSKLVGPGASVPSLTKAAMTALQQYPFPGNVRELENILERALALFDGNTIDVNNLNLPMLTHKSTESPGYDPALGSLEDHLEAIERKAITQALEDNKWNKTAAAKQLGLSFRSFRYRLKKLSLEE
jgi:two-component system response regulator PilR (NtrC family)